MVVRWALTPTTPTTRAVEQPPAVVIPPAVLEHLLSPTPTAAARQIAVAAPEKLGGRAKSTDPALTKVATDEGVRLQGIPNVRSVAAAVYGSHAKKNVMLILAAAAPKIPTSDADTFVNNALIGSDVVVQPATYEAGSLGGRGVCAEAKSKGVQYAICGWADEGSVGIIICYYTSVAKLQTQFHALRAEIEKVS